MGIAKLKCTHCKERFPRDEMVRVPAGNFCGMKHAIQYAADKREKQRARQLAKAKVDASLDKKAKRKAVRDFNRRDTAWQHKHTQKAFNRMRVLEELLWFKERNMEPVCISCGNPLGDDQWCCGHFKTVGAQSGLRYDRNNTFLQHNRRCNQGLSGDIAGTKTTHGYREGLKLRFGEVEGQRIIDYCEQNTAPVKWDWERLEEMRAEFNARIRELEKLLGVNG